MSPFDEQVKTLQTVYQSRIRMVLRRSREEMLSPASVALFVAGMLAQTRSIDDEIMTTVERMPEYLCVVERTNDNIAVGDVLKLAIPPQKPFFGVMVSQEGSVFYYQGNGHEQKCTLENFPELKARLSPVYAVVYRRKEIIVP